MAEKPILNDPDVFPSEEVLQEALGRDFALYEAFLAGIAALGLSPEWRYYKDGKAWFCKICDKKKTVCWLSVWQGYFLTGFYFTEKYVETVCALDISEAVKADFLSQKPIGLLIPCALKITGEVNLRDALTLAACKKSLK